MKDTDKEKTTINPYIWEKDGEKRELELTDDPTVDYKDFRRKEAESIVKKILNGKKIVFVTANSGYGVTKFLIPVIGDLLREQNLILEPREHLDDSCLTHASELGDVLLIDELEDSQGNAENGLSILNKILETRPDIRVILLMDFDLHPLGKKVKHRLETNNAVDFDSLSPKLLNVEQATQYALEGPPFQKTGAKSTFFEGLTYAQAMQIIKIISRNYPLHFRVIQKVRSIDSYNEDDELITFEERLICVESGKCLRDVQRFIKTDPMGIVANN